MSCDTGLQQEGNTFVARQLSYKGCFGTEEVWGQFCSVQACFQGLAALLALSDHSRPAPAAARVKVHTKEELLPACSHHRELGEVFALGKQKECL